MRTGRQSSIRPGAGYMLRQVPSQSGVSNVALSQSATTTPAHCVEAAPADHPPEGIAGPDPPIPTSPIPLFPVRNHLARASLLVHLLDCAKSSCRSLVQRTYPQSSHEPTGTCANPCQELRGIAPEQLFLFCDPDPMVDTSVQNRPQHWDNRLGSFPARSGRQDSVQTGSRSPLGAGNLIPCPT